MKLYIKFLGMDHGLIYCSTVEWNNLGDKATSTHAPHL